jgi:hypothetical protein
MRTLRCLTVNPCTALIRPSSPPQCGPRPPSDALHDMSCTDRSRAVPPAHEVPPGAYRRQAPGLCDGDDGSTNPACREPADGLVGYRFHMDPPNRRQIASSWYRRSDHHSCILSHDRWLRCSPLLQAASIRCCTDVRVERTRRTKCSYSNKIHTRGLSGIICRRAPAICVEALRYGRSACGSAAPAVSVRKREGPLRCSREPIARVPPLGVKVRRYAQSGRSRWVDPRLRCSR